MQATLNCWEFWRCGRESGGKNTRKFGPCPAAIETTFNGKNGGINAGRCCWAVAGTHCGGIIQGRPAEKIGNGLACEFYRAVTAR